MKILLIASMEYPEPQYVRNWIERLPTDSVLVTRAKSSSEKIAVETAQSRGISVVVMKCIRTSGKSSRDRNKALISSSEKAIFFCDGLECEKRLMDMASLHMKLLRIGPDGHIF